MRNLTYTEFVKAFCFDSGSNGIKKKVILDAIMEHSVNYTTPGSFHTSGIFDPAQRVAHGRYMGEWSDDNPYDEPTIRVDDSSANASSESSNESSEDSVEASTAVVTDLHAPRKTETPQISLVPNRNKGFIRTSHYANIARVLKSRMFFPLYLTGDTGCGKTLTVTQACAIENRELIRLNFTEQTNESHIIGSYRIIDGETIWSDGPAITAMRRGAVLLLDEVDLGSPKMMCLQPILEGSSYYIERTGELVEPADGFTIIATANTKGKLTGESRKFVGARVQNEAFLDRFSMTMEFAYPTEKQETRILNHVAESTANQMGTQLTQDDRDFLSTLITWTRSIRDSYVTGAFDYNLTTRRAKDILRSYFILDRKIPAAIKGGISRFDEDTQKAFQQLFNSLNNADIDWGNNEEPVDEDN